MTTNQKSLALLENIISAHNNILSHIKKLPDTGKKRNIFTKTILRRPRNRIKRKYLMSIIITDTMRSMAELEYIKCPPVPKFIKGADNSNQILDAKDNKGSSFPVYPIIGNMPIYIFGMDKGNKPDQIGDIINGIVTE